MARKTKEQISYNMSQVRSANTAIERIFAGELDRRGIVTYTKNDRSVFGRPDFVFKARKVAVFCDSEFWHGYNWDEAKLELKSNREFWINKIEGNIKRDTEVTLKLKAEGWRVLRFWERQIKETLSECVDIVEITLRAEQLQAPYRTVDLCAGIGGVRRGFELTGLFRNVLSAEKDTWACKTYEHIFGDDPNNDVTSKDFKMLVEQTPYDVLLAGFPCQTFSRVGLEEGFENEEKGKIFHHIAEILERTRPCSFLTLPLPSCRKCAR